MPLNLFYIMVQKSQKWPKTQIKGGSCLNKRLPFLALVLYKFYLCGFFSSFLVSFLCLLRCVASLSTTLSPWFFIEKLSVSLFLTPSSF